MADAGNDKWLDLIERFAARGADIRVGDLTPGFVRHLLDSVEELEQNLKGVEDKLRRLSEPKADG